MADDSQNWVPAGEAQKLLREATGDVESRRTICKRAHLGLIRARAQNFFVDRQARGRADVPKEFWWAEGETALEQNWSTGDFETWVNNGSVRLQAFGVSFARQDIEALGASTGNSRNSAPQAQNGLEDSDLRARLLKTVFDLRHQNGGRVPVTDTIFSGLPQVDRHVMSTICEHLKAANLIEWQPVFGSGSVGYAKITGFGVDVYLGKTRSPIDISLPSRQAGYGDGGYGDGPYGYGTPLPPSTPQAERQEPRPSADHEAARASARIIRQNRDAIQVAAAALAVLLGDKLAALKAQRLNSPEAQAEIEHYEQLESNVEALCASLAAPKSASEESDSALQAALNFGDTVKRWWQQRHVVALDTGLFLSSVAICHLTGASDLVVAVCGSLVGGQRVVEVVKGYLDKSRK